MLIWKSTHVKRLAQKDAEIQRLKHDRSAVSGNLRRTEATLEQLRGGVGKLKEVIGRLRERVRTSEAKYEAVVDTVSRDRTHDVATIAEQKDAIRRLQLQMQELEVRLVEQHASAMASAPNPRIYEERLRLIGELRRMLEQRDQALTLSQKLISTYIQAIGRLTNGVNQSRSMRDAAVNLIGAAMDGHDLDAAAASLQKLMTHSATDEFSAAATLMDRAEVGRKELAALIEALGPIPDEPQPAGGPLGSSLASDELEPLALASGSDVVGGRYTRAGGDPTGTVVVLPTGINRRQRS